MGELPMFLVFNSKIESHGNSSVFSFYLLLFAFIPISVFYYTRQFNTLAQSGTYHVDTDEKKANLYHAGLTIHLQEHLGQFSSLSYNELASAAIDQERLMKAVVEADEKKRKRMMPASAGSGSFIGAPLSTAWCIPHLGVSYADCNSSRIGAITYNINSDSSTVLLLHHRSRLPSGHHSSLPPATFNASIVRRWGTRVSATSPSNTTRHELRHPWSTSRGATKGVLHHGLAVPTTPPWMRSPWEKTC
jgi:hypothetical protein